MADYHPGQLTRFAKFALAIWGITLIGSGVAITAYSNTPGQKCVAVSQWPTDTQIATSGVVPTIVLFLHPKCACSVATLREFERALHCRKTPFDIRIGLFCPSGAPDAWTNTNLSRLAERIAPGSTFVDRSATEANRFGAKTSGHLLAFSDSGQRIFSGGITSARGHEGESAGSLALQKIFQSKNDVPCEQPVFGCPLIHSTNSIVD